MRAKMEKDLNEHRDVLANLLANPTVLDSAERLAKRIIESYRKGGKTIFFGNGGSASDAQHLSAELVARLKIERPMLNSLALNVNTSVITAIANDYSYDDVFARQIEHLVDQKDVVVGLSTSGKSTNVIKALISARNNGAFAVGMTGSPGRPIEEVCDLTLSVPSNNTPRIQEMHITLGHIICEIVEDELFGKKYGTPK